MPRSGVGGEAGGPLVLSPGLAVGRPQLNAALLEPSAAAAAAAAEVTVVVAVLEIEPGNEMVAEAALGPSTPYRSAECWETAGACWRARSSEGRRTIGEEAPPASGEAAGGGAGDGEGDSGSAGGGGGGGALGEAAAKLGGAGTSGVGEEGGCAGGGEGATMRGVPSEEPEPAPALVLAPPEEEVPLPLLPVAEPAGDAGGESAWVLPPPPAPQPSPLVLWALPGVTRVAGVSAGEPRAGRVGEEGEWAAWAGG